MINLNGFVFAAFDTSGWVYSDLTDWLSVTDAKGGLSDRPAAHGSFDPGVWWRESASPSFRCHYLGEDAVSALTALSGLRGLAGSDTLVPMTVDLGDGPLSRMVRIHSIQVDDTHGRSAVSAEVYLQAPDPLMYGPAVSGATGVPTPGVGVADPIKDSFQEGDPGTLGRVTLTNVGTAQTSRVMITVAGGLSEGVEVLVTDTGRVLRLDRLIPDGSQVLFNSRTGRVQLDGQSDVTGFLTVDEWSQIPAGATRTFQFVPLGVRSGVPQMTVTAFPAYF